MREVWIHPLGYGPVLLKKFMAVGWRSFLVDLEHNFLTEEEVMTAVHVIRSLGGSAVVRPPSPDPAVFTRLLEAGADRFLVAGIADPGPLLRLRDAARAHAPYVGDISKIAIIPMIESLQALRNLDAIAGLDFIAGVHIGPNDLARNLGLASGRDFAALEPILRPAWATIRAHGKPVGNFIHTDWFPFFPYDEIDIGSVASHELLARGRVGLPPV